MKKLIFILLLLSLTQLNADDRKYSVSISIKKTDVTLEEAIELAKKYMKDGAEVTIQPVACLNSPMMPKFMWKFQDNFLGQIDSCVYNKIVITDSSNRAMEKTRLKLR